MKGSIYARRDEDRFAKPTFSRRLVPMDGGTVCLSHSKLPEFDSVLADYSVIMTSMVSLQPMATSDKRFPESRARPASVIKSFPTLPTKSSRVALAAVICVASPDAAFADQNAATTGTANTTHLSAASRDATSTDGVSAAGREAAGQNSAATAQSPFAQSTALPAGSQGMAVSTNLAPAPSDTLSSAAPRDDKRNTRVAYEVAGDDDPDADPKQLLALLPDGAGQSTTSMDELDLVLGQRQIFSDLRSLQDRITNTQRPTANVVGRHSTQSDNLEINQIEVSQDLYFDHGLVQLRPGFQAIDYKPQFGRGVSQYAAGSTGSYRISDVTAITGEFWLNKIRTGTTRNVTPTYDAFLTLRPSDTVRIDIDTSRRVFDNVASLQLGLTATSYGGSIDFTPMDGLRLTARGAAGLYSDGNRRRTEEAEAVWRIVSHPVIEAGLRATNFHFSEMLNHGYFNPNDYVSGEAIFRLQSSVSEKLTFELAGSGGIENASPGGTRPLVKTSLQAVYKVYGGWSIDGEVSYFSSRQSSSSGFSRTSAQLGLHYRF